MPDNRPIFFMDPCHDAPGVLRSTIKSLESKKNPMWERLVLLFSCDCVERAIQFRKDAIGRDADDYIGGTLKTMRKVANGLVKVSHCPSPFGQLSGSLANCAWALTWEGVFYASLYIADMASDVIYECTQPPPPHKGAYAAEYLHEIKQSAKEAEQRWQLAHLQGMIKQVEAQRGALLQVLKERGARMRQAPSFGSQLEEALFT